MNTKIIELKSKANQLTIELEKSLENILCDIVLEKCDANKEIIFESHLQITADDLCPIWLDIKRIYINEKNEIIIDDDNYGEWNIRSLSANELNALIKKM